MGWIAVHLTQSNKDNLHLGVSRVASIAWDTVDSRVSMAHTYLDDQRVLGSAKICGAQTVVRALLWMLGPSNFVGAGISWMTGPTRVTKSKLRMECHGVEVSRKHGSGFVVPILGGLCRGRLLTGRWNDGDRH